MKKKRENPKAQQPSSVAVVILGNHCWYFHPQYLSWKGSIGYKSQAQAIKAALEAGFNTVKVGGKVVARIKKEEPKQATQESADGSQEESSSEESTEEA